MILDIRSTLSNSAIILYGMLYFHFNSIKKLTQFCRAINIYNMYSKCAAYNTYTD